MNNIRKLQEDLEEQERLLKEDAIKAFNESTLNDDELKRLNEIREQKRIVSVEESVEGKVETDISDYVKTIENTVVQMKDTKVRLLSSSIIDKKVLEKDAEDRIKNMIVTEEEIDMDAVMEEALIRVRNYLNKQNVTSDDVEKLAKLGIERLNIILPESYIRAFVEEEKMKYNKNKALESMLVPLACYVSIGPEMDNINDEIDRHNKMTNLMIKLADVSIDMLEVITAEESLSDLTNRVLSNNNELNNTYKKYVKNPSAINNIYIQKAFIMEKLAEGYEKLREEYNDPEELAEIDNEINKDRTYAKMYTEILELTRISSVVKMLADNKVYEGISDDKLNSYAFAALDSLRKIPEEVSIPGMIPGKNKHIKEIYNDYLTFFSHLIVAYNKVIDTATENGDDVLKRIDISGEKFAMYLIIVLARIARILTKKRTVETSIELSIIFDMTCRLGTELFMLDKLNTIISELYN